MKSKTRRLAVFALMVAAAAVFVRVAVEWPMIPIVVGSAVLCWGLWGASKDFGEEER